MKKTFIPFFILAISALASDPVSIDSLFKSQQGIRSITTLSFVSSGSANTYSIYPELLSENDGKIWMDTKSVSLAQTFIYGVSRDFDVLVTANGSSKRREYIDFSGYKNSDATNFESLWMGGVYSFDPLGDFKPQVSAQVAAYRKKEFNNISENLYANAMSVKASLKNYSDPVISTFSVGATVSGKNKIGGYKVEDGNQIFFGLDMSIILSPKVSLDIGLDQRYQMEAKTDGAKVSNSKSMPTMALGATYVLTPKASVSISGSAGGSSDAPDSIFSVSLWQKF